jgi:hypothetical protein
VQACFIVHEHILASRLCLITKMKVLKKKVKEGLVPQQIADKILEEALEPALHDMLHFHPSQQMIENLAAAIQSTIIERSPRFPMDDSKSSLDPSSQEEFKTSPRHVGIRGWFGAKFNSAKDETIQEVSEFDLSDDDSMAKINSASPLMHEHRKFSDASHQSFKLEGFELPTHKQDLAKK